ncbi:CAP domain-containing protein [Paraliobacillus sediminis]|uniref:CAP domain-containing protein n=1 Tax=Paraliobacillus sediminis TaxID=1885916 RepID=UPI000E3B86D7|nr:CAP domain-containing protein [Paraliobacillus sediminis]
MPSGVKRVIFVFLFGAGVFYMLQGVVGTKEVVSNVDGWMSKKEIVKESKVSPVYITEKVATQKSVFRWIGETTDVLRKEKGEPIRKDLSQYGYMWWVYQDGDDQYVQFGVKDKKIVTLYATGVADNFDPIKIGTTYKELEDAYQFEDQIVFSTYTFKLTEQDKKNRPLKQIDENLFIQFYFDSNTETLSSFRLMTEDVLLMQRPYEISYRGKLPEPPFVSEEDWQSIASGAEQQIFSITNVIRSRFNRNQLVWNQAVQEVAYNHSKDMEGNNYFSHYSQSGAGLKERLEVNKTVYKLAGENIAAQYVDAPAAVEGWLNSDAHRQALLKEEYTDLGVGVYREYYTQNFLGK